MGENEQIPQVVPFPIYSLAITEDHNKLYLQWKFSHNY